MADSKQGANPGEADEDQPDPTRRGLMESDQDPSGGIGVSSEVEGPAGPGQYAARGTRDTSPAETPGPRVPEDTAGGEETNPEGIEPKAGYPSLDPRSERHPYDPDSGNPGT